jgi:hypothetical protein
MTKRQHDRISELESQLSAKWKPIETAPVGEDVLTWAETIVPWSIECKNKNGRWERNSPSPTHWMPLPDGPPA